MARKRSKKSARAPKTPTVTNVLTTTTAAEIIGVARRSVYNWIQTAGLPSYTTPGGQHRINPSELARWLRDQGMPVPDELRG